MTVRRHAMWFALLAALPAGAGCSAKFGTLPPAAVSSDSADNSVGVTYPTATLETWYESSFCQLSTSGTSWQSPQCQKDVTFIAGQPDTGHFNLNDKPIVKNPLGVTGTTFEAIVYDTTVRLPAGSCTFPNAKTKCEVAVLNSAEGKKTGNYTYPGPLKILFSKTNNATALVANVSIPTSPALRAAEMAADVDLSRVRRNAVSIATLDDDSVVTPNNFDALVSKYPSKLARKVRLDQANLLVASLDPLTHATKYAPPDHNTAMVYELPYDLGILDGF